MLVQVDGCSSPVMGSRAPSILDSPTLARVERARLRHEAGIRDTSTLQSALGQTYSMSGSSVGSGAATGGLDTGFQAIKRGLLWQQRDRLFSRWKERYFVLTRDYLHCFKRANNRMISSDMGHFIFKIKLADVERVEWHNKKTYSTVSLDLGPSGASSGGGGGRILLRAPPQTPVQANANGTSDGVLEDWFELLEECMLNSKERRKTLMTQHRNSRDNNNMNSVQSLALDEWLYARRKNDDLLSAHCDSVPDLEEALAIKRRDRRWVPPDDDDWNSTTNSNRLSLLTDIDISASCDSSGHSAGGGGDSPSSIASTYRGLGHRQTSTQPIQGYRLNQDVFFLAAPPHQLQQPRDSPHSAKQVPYTNGAQSKYIQSPHYVNKTQQQIGNHQDNHRYIESMFSRGINQGRGSFHSTHRTTAPATPINTVVSAGNIRALPQSKQEMMPHVQNQQIIKYRERSYSDIQRMDRRQWKLRTDEQRRSSHLLEPAQG